MRDVVKYGITADLRLEFWGAKSPEGNCITWNSHSPIFYGG